MKELVAAIRDAPDDDGPRMVYADWLKLEPLLAATLPRLAGLDVSAGRLGPADVRRIGERFAVRRLDLGINPLGGLPVDALRDVEVLGLYAAHLADTDAVSIFASP